MKKKNELTVSETQPFLYEIRVKGQLAEERWVDWFEDLTITTVRGESILQGAVPDHAALYALLARLRDLAIPLLSVRVFDAEARRELFQQRKRYTILTNLTLLVVYIMLLGSMVGVMTYFISNEMVHTTLALAILFTAIGGLAYAFSVWSEIKAWLWITYATAPVSILTFLIFTSQAQILSPAIVISIILLLAAGGLLYVAYFLRSQQDRISDIIANIKR